MSLVAHSRSFTPVPGGIYFSMKHGKRTITCAHTKAGIAKSFGLDPARLDMPATFSANRAVFEHLASALYDTEAPSV